MRCEDVLNRLNARADGELRAEDAAELDAHLAECSPCRAEAEAIDAIDADLRREFLPRREAAVRLAESAVVAVRATTVAPLAVAMSGASARRFAWGPALAGLAAGFLLAVALFRPWQPWSVAPDSAPPLAPIARLAFASGRVEMRPASRIEFFTCPTNAPIGRDAIVRTGPAARCEIALEDGNALRLDCNTEVTLHESEVVEVNRGRLWWSSQPGLKGVEIQAYGCPIVAIEPAELAVDCQPHEARLIVVDGTVNVQSGEKSVEVGPGKQLRIVQGKLDDTPQACDALLETAWVNSVLALRSSDNPELIERVEQLLANIGAAKLSLLYEDELRRLGDAGVPPLLAYLASTRETPSVAQRATAARIVADVAESRWIADLIALLTDANADVRLHAARGLERLTGRDQGLAAQAWQTASWASCEPAHQKWLDWWAENRDHYPTARRDIPAPTSPPF